MYNEGVPQKDIATELGVTEVAVRSQLYYQRTHGVLELRQNPHRPWTARELRRLAEMYTRGDSLATIAAELDRTEATIRTYAAKLGLRRGDGKQRDHWSYEEAYKLVRLWRQGVTMRELAEECGRSVDAVKRKIIKLRREYGEEVVLYRYNVRRGRA
jgi:DNA-binding NarL/FixJ family response regulator